MSNLIKIFVILVFSMFSSLFGFSINDGFKLALENDMDFKVNKNNLKNIKIDQKIADALLYPSLDFSANVEASKLTQGKLTPDSEPLTKSDQYELKLTQPIFDGFESKFESKLQENKFKSAVYFLKETQDGVALNYSTAYLNTLREKDLLSLSKESLQISKDIFEKVYKKINVGYGTKLEYEEARGNLAENKVNLNIQKINLKEAIENLKLYVQTDFDSSELEKPNLNIELPRNVKDALEIAYKDNPAINVSKANVIVAQFEQRKTNKEFYPNVDFVGSYNINNALFKENDEEYNEYKVGFEVSYNLFNGGKDRLTEKKALQNVEDKELLVRKSEYQVKTDLRLAWNSYKLNKEKQESLKQYLIVKRDILDATNKEFDLGQKNLNILQETHVEYIDVKKDLIRNTYDLIIAKYKILNAMGKLTEALEDKIPTLDKIDVNELVQNNMDEDLDFSFNKDTKYKDKQLQIPSAIKKVENKEFKKRNVNFYETKNFTKTQDKTFKDMFLNASKDKYTINLAYTTSSKRAQGMIDKYNISNNAFYFSFGYDKPLQKIMYGVYNSKKEALEALNSLPNSLKRNKPRVESITIKQKLYAKYNGYPNTFENKLPTKDESKYKVINVAYSSPKREIANSIENIKSINFKDIFLNAQKNKYTINLAYTTSSKRAQGVIDKYNISNNAFYFSFGYDKPLQKIMYGVYNSKKEALEALNSLPNSLKRNRPRVENITIKQKLFHKYNKYQKSSYSRSI